MNAHKTLGHIETDPSKSENSVTLSRDIRSGSMFPGLDVEEKSLGLSQSALLILATLLIVLILHIL